MSEEKTYQFNNYVIGYDKGFKDRSCLTICDKQGDTLYVIDTLYDESANVMSKLLDSLQNQLQQKENIIKEVREYIEEKKYSFCDDYDLRCEDIQDILKILDKEGD